ncbi:hypothetical protein [Streptomyces sp. GbtcB6]|uniref:hypothetical protein n=1 Tax=Streptomyces sp. GbtcB6 TaxID=2824751 RepID=UPI001C2F8871|nr:hypothetical protein [Streptomyces sp. GbtcB6]
MSALPMGNTMVTANSRATAVSPYEQCLTGLVLVPWIACTRCGRILMRAHARERWGDLSYLARHYVILGRRGLRLPPACVFRRAMRNKGKVNE